MDFLGHALGISIYFTTLKTWFVVCGGRFNILNYGPLIETNNGYAPTPNGQSVRVRRLINSTPLMAVYHCVRPNMWPYIIVSDLTCGRIPVCQTRHVAVFQCVRPDMWPYSSVSDQTCGRIPVCQTRHVAVFQ